MEDPVSLKGTGKKSQYCTISENNRTQPDNESGVDWEKFPVLGGKTPTEKL